MNRALAGAAALALHAALLLAFAASLSGRPAYLSAHSDGAAMFASLTPAGSLQTVPSSSSAAMPQLEALDRGLASADPTQPAGPGHAAGDALLAAIDAAGETTGPSSRSSQTQATSSSSPLALKDVPNPYEHASITTADPSRVQALWEAIRPCWRGSASESSAIRVVLDRAGQVKDMTLVQGRLGDPRSEAAAQAILACAPYRVGTAGAYLARVPA